MRKSGGRGGPLLRPLRERPAGGTRAAAETRGRTSRTSGVAESEDGIDPLLYPGGRLGPSIIVLAADKFRTNRAVRFHAFQGLYLFVAWLIVQQVIAPWFRHFPGEMFRMDRV